MANLPAQSISSPIRVHATYPFSLSSARIPATDRIRSRRRIRPYPTKDTHRVVWNLCRGTCLRRPVHRDVADSVPIDLLSLRQIEVSMVPMSKRPCIANLDQAVEALYNLHVNVIGNGPGRHERPHKPCLLLAVLDLVASGKAVPERIPWNQSLRDRFSAYFSIVGTLQDKCAPELPFRHLKSEGVGGETVVVDSHGGRRPFGHRFCVAVRWNGALFPDPSRPDAPQASAGDPLLPSCPTSAACPGCRRFRTPSVARNHGFA